MELKDKENLIVAQLQNMGFVILTDKRISNENETIIPFNKGNNMQIIYMVTIDNNNQLTMYGKKKFGKLIWITKNKYKKVNNINKNSNWLSCYIDNRALYIKRSIIFSEENFEKDINDFIQAFLSIAFNL